MDVGCAECKLLKLLRREEYIQELVGVDLRESVLEAQCSNLQPLAADFIILRKQPLTLRLMQGVYTHEYYIHPHCEVVSAPS